MITCMNKFKLFYLSGLLCLISFNNYAEYDISGIDQSIPNRPGINFDNLNRNADEPTLDVNFFNIPKSMTNLNLAREPMVTRGSGTNVFNKAAPKVVKIFNDDGEGSGSFISSKGEIITNWHVVEGWTSVGVILYDERDNPDNPAYLLGDVIKWDPKVDLALVKLKETPRNLEYFQLGGLPQVGAEVHAIGHAEGFDWSYTKGYISGIRNDYFWEYDESAHTANVIQTQTPINPGSSGGPLLSDRGEIVGVNSFGFSESDGLNFAISISEVKQFIKSNEQDFGPVIAPSLFIGAIDADEDGKDDMWMWDLTDDEIPDVLGFDDDGDGIIDDYDLVEFANNCFLSFLCEEDFLVIGHVSIQEIYGRKEVVWLLDEDGDGESESGGIDYNRDGFPDFIEEF